MTIDEAVKAANDICQESAFRDLTESEIKLVRFGYSQGRYYEAIRNAKEVVNGQS